jgi:hypothetical protein
MWGSRPAGLVGDREWTDRGKILMFCSSTQEDSLPSACLRGLARHFKTEPTETVALCFGYPKTPCLRAKGNLSASVDNTYVKLLHRWCAPWLLPASQDAGNRITHVPVILKQYWNRSVRVRWVSDLGPQLGTPIWDSDLGPRIRTPIWDPDLGPRFGTLIWDPDLGPRVETLIWDPNLGPQFGSSIWDTPIWDLDLGPRFRTPPFGTPI